MPDIRLGFVFWAALLLAAPLSAVPDAALEPIERARAALAQGDGIAGEAEWNKALEAGANREEVAAGMGEALIAQGALGRAREWLGPGRFAKGQELYGWRMLGLLERLEGHFPAAGAAYDKALALDRKDPQLWVDIGRMRYAGGEQLLALDAAEFALQLAPDNIRALEFKAELVRDRDGPLAALPLYEAALEIAPDDAILLAGYAGTLGAANRAAEMLAAVRRLSEIAPGHPSVFYLQSLLAARAGNFALARDVLNRAGEDQDRIPAVAMLKGILELEAGNAYVASGMFEELAARQGANQRVQLLLARALYEAGEHSRLFQRFTAMAERPDAPAYLLTLLGRAHEDGGAREKAARYLDRAAFASAAPVLPVFENDPPGVLSVRWRERQGDAGIVVPYVRSLLAAQQVGEASVVAERYRALFPQSSEALGLAGDVALAAGRPAKAIEWHSQASKVRFPEARLLRLREAYQQSGDGNQARELAARYLAAWPQSALAARLVASDAMAAGDWARSATLLQNLRLRSSNRDAWLLFDLSIAQLRSGDSDAALATARRASAIQPANFGSGLAEAMALTELGRDLPRAAILLDRAERMAGKRPLIAETRAKLVRKNLR